METTSENRYISNSLKEALASIYGQAVTVLAKSAVHGGDANDAYILRLSNGKNVFKKENSISNTDFFRAEAEGIEAIKETGVIRVPEMYAIGVEGERSFLLMESIDRAATRKDFWEDLGTRLAKMHMASTDKYLLDGRFGFKSNNYIGAGKQDNTPCDNWIEFFAQRRLLPQFRQAEHYFDKGLIRAANHLIDNLDRVLVKPERPSLLHGDLWAGNFMSDENGSPILIDPAVYVGCNEADIAMTELFGGFDNRFYDAYFETFGVTPGYEDRRDIYNLYHLTNHLNLFGISYLSAVARIIYRYQCRLVRSIL